MNTNNFKHKSDGGICENSSKPFEYNKCDDRADRVTLEELCSIIWAGKWIIFGVTIVCASLGVFYALSLPAMYTSKGIYTPAKQANSASPVAGQFGGLAAMAGINLGSGGNNDVDQAMELLVSWPFLESVVDHNDLSPEVNAVQKWNSSTGELIYDSKIYDSQKRLWLTSEEGVSLRPTSYEVFQDLRDLISVSHDPAIGMISISVTHYSPNVAKQWVNLLISAVNEHFQHRDMVEARRNINYLEAKISETGIAEMQAVFYGMIESQMRTLMLAEVGGDYLLKEVVPPMIQEKKSKPARTVITIFFALIGFLGAVISILTKVIINRTA